MIFFVLKIALCEADIDCGRDQVALPL